MNRPSTTYAWQQIYMAAVAETNNQLMQSRIYEALAALEQRRLTPIEQASEDRALIEAEMGLRALIAERIDGFETR